MDDGPAAGALDGVRVLDLTTVVMGPYATQVLGDLGADVVKVETGDGDGSRVMGGGPHQELSGVALNLHRNKRSIGLDLKHALGKEAFLALLDRSDVLVTNLRPEPMRAPRARLRRRRPDPARARSTARRTGSAATPTPPTAPPTTTSSRR